MEHLVEINTPEEVLYLDREEYNKAANFVNSELRKLNVGCPTFGVEVELGKVSNGTTYRIVANLRKVGWSVSYCVEKGSVTLTIGFEK